MGKDNHGIRVIGSGSVFSDTAISKNGSINGNKIDLLSYRPIGYFSVRLTTVGAGQVDLTYEVSDDGVTWYTPVNFDQTSVQDVCTAHVAGSKVYPFYPVLAPYVRLVATEDNTGSITSISAEVFIQ